MCIYIVVIKCLYVGVVCVYARMHACMHVCMCVVMFVCMYACICVCMCVCKCVYMYLVVFKRMRASSVRSVVYACVCVCNVCNARQCVHVMQVVHA